MVSTGESLTYHHILSHFKLYTQEQFESQLETCKEREIYTNHGGSMDQEDGDQEWYRGKARGKLCGRGSGGWVLDQLGRNEIQEEA